MARMYEMNLIIRLQDRASARMRRISGDMSAMARHAQQQQKFSQLQASADMESVKALRAQQSLHKVRATDGAAYNNLLARRKMLEGQIMDSANRLDKLGVTRWQRMVYTSQALTDAQKKSLGLSNQQIAAMKRYEAALLRQQALTAGVAETEAALVAEIEAASAAQARLNAQIARTAPLIEAQNAAARKYSRGRAAAHAGSLAFMGGAVTLGASAVAAGSFASFDVRAAKAATQLGDTNLRIGPAIEQTKKLTADLETRILGLSRDWPATAQEMTDAVYNIFSSMELGSTAAERMTNGMKVLTEANKAAVGGQVDLATATDTLITIFNDFDPTIGNINKNMAELFAIVRFMRGGFAELNAGMNKLAPAAKQAHYSLLDVGAAFAVITQAIPSAAQASTAEARLIDLFGRKQFIDGMERYGRAVGAVNTQFSVLNKRTGQLRPIQDIIGNILKIDPSLAEGGPRLFNFIKQITQLGSETGKGGVQGTIFQTKALSVLITEHQKHLNILRQAKQDTIEYDKSVKALSETADVKWKTAMNNMRVVWIQFGRAAMPILLDVLEAATKLFNQFNKMSDSNKEWVGRIVVIIGLLATMSGLFGSAFGGATMVLATMKLRKLQKAIEAVTIAEGEMRAVAAAPFPQTGIFGTRLGKVAGWLGVIVLSFEALKGMAGEVTKDNLDASGWQKAARGWVGMSKGMEGFIAGGIDDIAGVFGKNTNLKKASDEAWDALYGRFPGLFGKVKPQLTKTEKEAIASANRTVKGLKKVSDDNLAAVLKAYQAQAAGVKKLIQWEKLYEKAKIEAMQSAKKEAEQTMKSREEFLRSTESGLRAINKQGSELFGGPVAGGPILSAFDSINKTLMGVGVMPIKIPVQFLLQDQQMQAGTFDLWRKSLDTLGKRLGPKYRGMIVDLQKQGVASLPQVMSMSTATDAQLTQWKTTWAKMQTVTEEATHEDMKRLTDLWKSYGPDVLAAILDGADPDEARSKMYDSYKAWIVGNMPQTLAAEFAKAYTEALNNWLATHPKPKLPGGPTETELTAASNAAEVLDTAKQYIANQRKHGWYAQSNPNLQPKPTEASPMGPPAPKHTPPPPSRFGYGQHWPGYGGGGTVGGFGTGDTVPAWLTPGEVVLNKRHIANASKMLGTRNHPHALFNKVDRFAEGGVVGSGHYKFRGVPKEFASREAALMFLNNSPGYVSRQGDYLNRFWPGLMGAINPQKHSKLHRFVHYGLGDAAHDIKSGYKSYDRNAGRALRGVDEAQSHISGIHTKTFLKTYTDAVGIAKLSPKQQAESRAFAEGIMAFHGVGGGLAKNAAGGFSTRGSLGRATTAKHVYFGNDRAVMGITPGGKGIPSGGIPIASMTKEQVKAAQEYMNVVANKKGHVMTREFLDRRKALLARQKELAGTADKVEYVDPQRVATIAEREADRVARASTLDEFGRDIPIGREEALARAKAKAAARKKAYDVRRPKVVERAEARRQARIASLVSSGKILSETTIKEVRIAMELLNNGYPEAAQNVLNKLATPGIRIGKHQGEYRGKIPVLVEQVLKDIKGIERAQEILAQTGPKGTIHPWSRTVRTADPSKKAKDFDPKAFKAQVDRLVKAEQVAKENAAKGLPVAKPKPQSKRVSELMKQTDPFTQPEMSFGPGLTGGGGGGFIEHRMTPGQHLMQNILATTDPYMQKRIARMKAEGKWPEGRPSTAEEVLQFHLNKWPDATVDYRRAMLQWRDAHIKMGKEFPIPNLFSILDNAMTPEAIESAIGINRNPLMNPEFSKIGRSELPAQDLFSEVGRVEAKKMLAKLKGGRAGAVKKAVLSKLKEEHGSLDITAFGTVPIPLKKAFRVATKFGTNSTTGATTRNRQWKGIINTALEDIGKVHDMPFGFGMLPGSRVPILERSTGEEFGFMMPGRTLEVGPMDVVPKHIGITNPWFMPNPFPTEMIQYSGMETVAHEIGHALDAALFGMRKRGIQHRETPYNTSWFGSAMSMSDDPWNVTPRLPGVNPAALDNVFQSIFRSKDFTGRFKRAGESPEAARTRFTKSMDAFVRYAHSPQDIRDRVVAHHGVAPEIPYHMKPQEAFARSYAQWVMSHELSSDAVRDAHKVIYQRDRGLERLNAAIAGPGVKPVNLMTMERNDFWPIKNAFDELFSSHGLMRGRGYNKGGWVGGPSGTDKVPAWLTRGEYVVDKPTINALSSQRGVGSSTTTSNDIHVTVQATNPTEESILNALKPVLFSLRHSR